MLVVSDLAAGDFVRWMKQLIDLAGQVAGAAGDGPLRETARQVVAALRRGVVAYSGLADEAVGVGRSARYVRFGHQPQQSGLGSAVGDQTAAPGPDRGW